MTEAVFFDFDGVISQTETYKLDRLTAYYRKLGLKVDTCALYLLAGGTFGNKEAIMDCIFGDQSRYWEVRDLAMDHHVGPFPHKELRTPGIVETLEEIHKRRIPVLVASNSRKERLIQALEECEVLTYIDHIESAYDLKRLKPDPYVYRNAMDRMGVKPENCIVVEDSALGIQAGKKAGARVIALRDRDGAIDQSQADVIVTEIQEVLQYLR